MKAFGPASLAVLLLVASWVGCGKDEETGPEPSEITGVWQATKLEYVHKANPSTRVDLVAAGGSATLTIGTDHHLLFVVTESGALPDTTTGTWNLDGDLFEVSPTGMPWTWTWDVSLAGNSLSLTGADMEYDFDGDDVPEEAEQNATFVR